MCKRTSYSFSSSKQPWLLLYLCEFFSRVPPSQANLSLRLTWFHSFSINHWLIPHRGSHKPIPCFLYQQHLALSVPSISRDATNHGSNYLNKNITCIPICRLSHSFPSFSKPSMAIYHNNLHSMHSVLGRINSL